MSGNYCEILGTKLPILSIIGDGWYLVKHPNGPAVCGHEQLFTLDFFVVYDVASAEMRRAGAMTTLNNDVSAEQARALHRVVRAMHDGNCPKCGHLGPSDTFYHADGVTRYTTSVPVVYDEPIHACPSCGFLITETVAKAALEAFRPFMEANVGVFEEWQAKLAVAAIEQRGDTVVT